MTFVVMKVKTIARSEEDMTRERPRDTVKVHRNLDPALHPFERAREYTRTVNAVKLDKVFAKPFVAALNGHMDGVCSMATSRAGLTTVASGACDGEIRIWDLSDQTTARAHPKAHTGWVRGLTCSRNGEVLVSCGNDKLIKIWRLGQLEEDEDEEEVLLNTFYGKHAFVGVDHAWEGSTFATVGGTVVEVWDQNRNKAVHTFSWGTASPTAVRFNPAEPQLFASAASDRNICLYDLRTQTPIQKTVLRMRTNAICWNPMEAFNFVTANEDHNLYTFDMRKMDKALCVHKDHVSAVMDVDYSPTGREFVTGSYDRTVRIFGHTSGHSREVYHTKRMQRIFNVKFTQDSKFVLSASDDMNVRIWKAKASAALKTLVPRERKKLEYQEKLKKRYGHMTEVKRISRHRHLPKSIMKAGQKKEIMKKSDQRKEANRRAHGQGAPLVPERKKSVLRVEK